MREKQVVFIGGVLEEPSSTPERVRSRYRALDAQARGAGTDVTFFIHGFQDGIYGYFHDDRHIPLNYMPERVELAFGTAQKRIAICLSGSGVTAINLAIMNRCHEVYGLSALVEATAATRRRDPRLSRISASNAIDQGIRHGWCPDNAVNARTSHFEGQLILAYSANNALDRHHAQHMAHLPRTRLHQVKGARHVFWNNWSDYRAFSDEECTKMAGAGPETGKTTQSHL